MSIALALLGKSWPYLLAALIAGSAGMWLQKRADSIAYNRLQNEYSGFRLMVADREADAQKAAREALQKQIDDRHDTDRRNEETINALTQKAAAAESDSALARRLLAAAQKAGLSGRYTVSQAGHQPGTAQSSEASGDGPLATAVAAAINEARANERQCNALLEELKPQL